MPNSSVDINLKSLKSIKKTRIIDENTWLSGMLPLSKAVRWRATLYSANYSLVKKFHQDSPIQINHSLMENTNITNATINSIDSDSQNSFKIASGVSRRSYIHDGKSTDKLSVDSRHRIVTTSLRPYVPLNVKKSRAREAALAADLLKQQESRKALSYRHVLPRWTRLAEAGEDPENNENSSASEYDADAFDTAHMRTGRHRTLIRLTGYTVVVNHFGRAAQLKYELNERFRIANPHIHPSLTLTQIRGVKERLLGAALEIALEVSTVARAYVYFEKLVQRRFVAKANRRAVGGCCILLAAKSTDSKAVDFPALLERLSSALAVRKELLSAAEFPVFAALKFRLQIPYTQIEAQISRILDRLDYSNLEEYLGHRMHHQFMSLQN